MPIILERDSVIGFAIDVFNNIPENERITIDDNSYLTAEQLINGINTNLIDIFVNGLVANNHISSVDDISRLTGPDHGNLSIPFIADEFRQYGDPDTGLFGVEPITTTLQTCLEHFVKIMLIATTNANTNVINKTEDELFQDIQNNFNRAYTPQTPAQAQQAREREQRERAQRILSQQLPNYVDTNYKIDIIDESFDIEKMSEEYIKKILDTIQVNDIVDINGTGQYKSATIFLKENEDDNPFIVKYRDTFSGNATGWRFGNEYSSVEYVECNDYTLDEWLGNVYRNHVKPDGRTFVKLYVNGAIIIVIKPDWWDNEIPGRTKIFSLIDAGSVYKFVNKWLVDSYDITLPEDYSATGVDHCNQKALQKVYRLEEIKVSLCIPAAVPAAAPAQENPSSSTRKARAARVIQKATRKYATRKAAAKKAASAARVIQKAARKYATRKAAAAAARKKKYHTFNIDKQLQAAASRNIYSNNQQAAPDDSNLPIPPRRNTNRYAFNVPNNQQAAPPAPPAPAPAPVFDFTEPAPVAPPAPAEPAPVAPPAPASVSDSTEPASVSDSTETAPRVPHRIFGWPPNPQPPRVIYRGNVQNVPPGPYRGNVVQNEERNQNEERGGKKYKTMRRNKKVRK